MGTSARRLGGMDHRWGERFLVDLPVRVSSPGVSGINGRLKNLSLSGPLIESEVDLRLYALIELKVTLSTPERREVVIGAHVTRRRGDEVGVEWCDYASITVKELLWSARAGPAA